MRMLILGAGLQGSACAYDLLRRSDAEVTLADISVSDLPPFLASDVGARLSLLELDARDEAALAAALDGADAVMCALPYYFNLPVTRAAPRTRSRRPTAPLRARRLHPHSGQSPRSRRDPPSPRLHPAARQVWP